VEQVEIGKKGFFKPFKSHKNTIKGLWRLWRTLEVQEKLFQEKKGHMSSNLKLNWTNLSPIKLWKPHGKRM
jgi:hypothetical protein